MELWQFWDENTQKRSCVYHKMSCVVFCVKAGEKIPAKKRTTSVTHFKISTGLYIIKVFNDQNVPRIFTIHI